MGLVSLVFTLCGTQNKIVVLLIKPIGFFLTFSLSSASLDLKVPTISEATQNVRAICLGTLLENEMRSDVAVLPPK